ncbi:MAG: 50S ribosomal protein L23 [Candidatus Absconditabacterales bacterium]|jgi:large subunit ribosomal protein L23
MTFRQKLQVRAKKNVRAKVIKKFSPYEIILSPIVTEKTHKQQEIHKYCFKIHNEANKNDVKEALQYIYKITPLAINMVNVVYKSRNQKKLNRKAYKKALVTLDKKDKIEVGS